MNKLQELMDSIYDTLLMEDIIKEENENITEKDPSSDMDMNMDSEKDDYS